MASDLAERGLNEGLRRFYRRQRGDDLLAFPRFVQRGTADRTRLAVGGDRLALGRRKHVVQIGVDVLQDVLAFVRRNLIIGIGHGNCLPGFCRIFLPRRGI